MATPDLDYLQELELRLEDSQREIQRLREQLQQEISDRQQLYQQQIILDTIPAMLVLKDRENRILRINKKAAAESGLSPEEIEGKTDWDINPDVADEYYQADLEVIHSGLPKSGTIESLTPTGKRWIQTQKVPWRDSRGDIGGVLVFAVDITLTKQVELSTLESLTRFDLVAKASQEGLWDVWKLGDDLLHPDTPIYYSPRFKELLGYEDSEFPNTLSSWGSRLHPEDRDRVITTLLDHLNHQVPYRNIEHRLQCKNGEYRTFLANGQAIWDAEGKPTRMAGSLRDITTRKQEQVALQKSEEQFRATFKQAAVGIAQVSLECQYLRVNQKFCDIIGYTEAEVLARTFIDFTYPEDLDTDWDNYCALIALEIETYSIEKRYIHKQGFPVWVKLTVSLVHTPGEPIYTMAIIEDISDIKQQQAKSQALEKELARRQAHFNAFFLTAPVGLEILDKDLRFTHVNETLAGFDGCSIAEHIGKTLSEVVPEIAPHIEPNYRHVLETGEPLLNFEETGITPRNPGVIHHWMCSRFPLFDETGQPDAIGSVIIDITEKKNVESALRYRVEIEQLVVDISKSFINLAPEQIDEGINQALKVLGEFSGVDRSYIFTFSEDKTTYSNTQEWCAEGILPEIQNLQNLPVELLGSCLNNLQQFNTVYIPSVAKLSPELGELQTHLKEQEIQSLILVPMVYGNVLVGFLGFDSVREVKVWAEEDIALLETIGEIFVSAKERKRSQEALQQFAQRETLINRLTLQIRNSLEIDTILETAVQEVQHLLQIERCIFLWYRPDPTEPYWEVMAEAKNPDITSVKGSRTTATRLGLVSTKVLNKEILRLNDTQNSLNQRERDFFRATGEKAIVILPIHTQAGEIGLLGCIDLHQARNWSDSEVELMQSVADQLAIAITQAQLYTQSRTAATLATEKAAQLQQALHTLQETQSQLIQTEKMSSLGQLVAGVAHEINNPVSFIYGNVTYADRYIEDLLELVQLYRTTYPQATPEIQNKEEAIDLDFLIKDLPKILTSMKVGADRIRDLVLSLRNFSRLDEAEMKPVDIHEGIDNTLLILQHRLKEKAELTSIEVIKDYGDLPPVECYAGQLNQVFMNLIANAIDALEEQAHAKPQITLRTCLNSVGQVTITIADNGRGMTEHTRSRLFDPFFTTKPIGKGTGLGLSISYQIVVEKHKGTLECQSFLGQGTKFVITLPSKKV